MGLEINIPFLSKGAQPQPMSRFPSDFVKVFNQISPLFFTLELGLYDDTRGPLSTPILGSKGLKTNISVEKLTSILYD